MSDFSTTNAMPLRYRSLLKEPGVFFVTSSTFDRNPFPGYPKSLAKIEEIMFRTAKEKCIIIMGYVIMPSHIHLIIGSNQGGPGISRFMHSLKGRVRIELIGKGRLWQARFDDLLLTTEKQFNIKLEYIHENPIKAELVEDPGAWRFSSYNDWDKRDYSRGIIFDYEWLQ
jgi:putative transposase